MKVQEYRDLTNRLSDAFASFRSATTPHERRVEAECVKRVTRDLMAANAPRLSLADKVRAERWLDATAKAMIEHDAQCKAADAALQTMAFGGEYR